MTETLLSQSNFWVDISRWLSKHFGIKSQSKINLNINCLIWLLTLLKHCRGTLWVDKACVDMITSEGFTEVNRDVALESKDTFCLLVFLIWFQALELAVNWSQPFVFLWEQQGALVESKSLWLPSNQTRRNLSNDPAREAYRQLRDLQCMLTHGTKQSGPCSVRQIIYQMYSNKYFECTSPNYVYS